MALNNHDQARVREYLLGKLSAVEREKIEERLMVEDELFDEFEVSKDELVEAYCAGELGEAERRWFEEHFLASREGRERQAFVLAMNCLREPQPVVMEESIVQPAVQIDRRVSSFERFERFVRVQPWAVATAVAVVIVVAIGFVVIRNGSRVEGQTFNATLTTSAIRRGGEGPLPTKIHLPSDTAKLQLHLDLPKPASAGTSYKAELDDRLRTKTVELVQSDPQSVTVAIPSALLPRGEYSLELTATHADGTAQQLSYQFNVE